MNKCAKTLNDGKMLAKRVAVCPAVTVSDVQQNVFFDSVLFRAQRDTPVWTRRLIYKRGVRTKNKLDGRMCGPPHKLLHMRRPTPMHILETVGIGDTDDRTVVRLQKVNVGRTITHNIYIFCFPHICFFGDAWNTR